MYTEDRLQLLPLLSPRLLLSKSRSHVYSPTGTAKKIGVWGVFLIVLEFFKGLLGKDSKNEIVEFCLFLVFRRSSQSATKADTEGKKNKDRRINYFYWRFLVTFQKIILTGSRVSIMGNLEREYYFWANNT